MANGIEKQEHLPGSQAGPSTPGHLLCTRHFVTSLNAGPAFHFVISVRHFPPREGSMDKENLRAVLDKFWFCNFLV